MFWVTTKIEHKKLTLKQITAQLLKGQEETQTKWKKGSKGQ